MSVLDQDIAFFDPKNEYMDPFSSLFDQYQGAFVPQSVNMDASIGNRNKESLTYGKKYWRMDESRVLAAVKVFHFTTKNFNELRQSFILIDPSNVLQQKNGNGNCLFL